MGGVAPQSGAYPSSAGGGGGVPQPPPAAATPTLERHNSRASLVRSNSINMSSGYKDGTDEVTYWGNEIVGMSGLKNLGK